MPLYEYECEACDERFERIQKFSDPPPERCPKCGKGPVHKQLSSPAFQFKGSGWYITDYARKGGGSGESSSTETGEKSAKAEKGEKGEKKADAAPAAAKSETTSTGSTTGGQASKSSDK